MADAEAVLVSDLTNGPEGMVAMVMKGCVTRWLGSIDVC